MAPTHFVSILSSESKISILGGVRWCAVDRQRRPHRIAKGLEDPAGLDFVLSFDGLEIVEGKIDHDTVLANATEMGAVIGENSGMYMDVPSYFCIPALVRAA